MNVLSKVPAFALFPFTPEGYFPKSSGLVVNGPIPSPCENKKDGIRALKTNRRVPFMRIIFSN
jgi:hypothetical protein